LYKDNKFWNCPTLCHKISAYLFSGALMINDNSKNALFHSLIERNKNFDQFFLISQTPKFFGLSGMTIKLE